MDIHYGGAFGHSPLDRLNNKRAEAGFIEACSKAPALQILVLDSSKRILVDSSPESTLSVAWIDGSGCENFDIDLTVDKSRLLLGSMNGAFYFAVVVDDARAGRCLAGTTFRSLRSCVAQMSSDDAAIAAQATSLLFFHERHRYCGLCGAKTIPEQGGARLRCSKNVHGEDKSVIQGSGKDKELADGSCSGVIFPRTDPVVIMLVVDSTSSRCLLGRQSRFPPGMYSCLAGFMEHGECIDDAARREVLEESGVRVGTSVRFYGSQPWPQPYSLMLGMVMQSDADGEAIQVDEKELEEACWFTREEVVDMVGQEILKNSRGARFVPPPTSIAGQMLRAFAASEPVTCFTPQTARL